MDKVYINGICFDSFKDELQAVVLSGNNMKEEMEAMREHGLKGVVLNRYFCGDRISNLDFLKDYPEVQDVKIVTDKIDCKGLLYLKDLHTLIIKGNHFPDYSIFPKLRVLSTTQKKPFILPDKLETLYMHECKMKEKGLSAFVFPDTIKFLSCSRTDLENLNSLPPTLEKLNIDLARRLTSLEGLENCAGSLRDLDIEYCPNIKDCSALEKCTNMEKLLLLNCGQIPSIGFVQNMNKLYHFAFSRSYVVDNDLSPLKSIPSVAFTNNKNYNYKLKDFRDDI